MRFSSWCTESTSSLVMGTGWKKNHRCRLSEVECNFLSKVKTTLLSLPKKVLTQMSFLIKSWVFLRNTFHGGWNACAGPWRMSRSFSAGDEVWWRWSRWGERTCRGLDGAETLAPAGGKQPEGAARKTHWVVPSVLGWWHRAIGQD